MEGISGLEGLECLEGINVCREGIRKIAAGEISDAERAEIKAAGEQLLSALGISPLEMARMASEMKRRAEAGATLAELMGSK